MAIYTDPARLNAIRVNAFRLGAGAYQTTVFVNGVQVTKYVRRLETEIRETASEAPNTCSLVLRNTQPSEGQQITIRAGGVILFDGQVATVTQIQSRSAERKRWRVEGIDWTRLLDRRLVFKSYVDQTPNAIITDVLTFTSGFTTRNVQAGLTWLNSATSATWTFVGESPSVILKKIALAVGATFKLRYDKDVYLRTTSTLASPTAIDTTAVALNKQFRRLSYDRKLDQIRTRVYVKGGRTSLTSAASVGATSLSVQDTTPFASSGGSALADDWQILAYTGIGSSSALPTPAAPTAALGYYDGANTVSINNCNDNGAGTITVTTNAAHGLSNGQTFIIVANGTSANGAWTVLSVTDSTHFTFTRPVDGANTANNGWLRPCIAASSMQTRANVCTVTTTTAHGFAAGMTVQVLGASPISYNGYWTVATVPSTTTFTIAMSSYPADSIDSYGTIDAGVLPGTSGVLVGAYGYKVSFAGGTAETLASAASGSVTATVVATATAADASFAATTGGSLFTNTYNYGFTLLTTHGESDVGAFGSVTLTGVQNAVSITIPWKYLLDPRVIGVNIWRTTAGAPGIAANARYAGTFTPSTTQFRQLGAFAMTYLDTLADSGLGAVPPTTNTSGGAIALTTVATSTDTRVLSRNVYRTASGGSTYKAAGSISDGSTASFADGTSDTSLGSVEPTAATPFPGSLTGVTGVTTALRSGASLALWVQRDDTTAQTALAALEGGDGIHEVQIDDPNILTTSAANARGDAELSLGKNVEEQVTYTTQDNATQVGATVSVNIGGIVTTQKIQSQRIYWVKDRKWPQRDIVATNLYKDLYQYLRDLQDAA